MQLSRPRYVTVSTRDVIYLADWDWGVFQSDDGGLNWRPLFALPKEANACQVVRVPADRGGVYWIVEYHHEHWQLREYQPSGNAGDINRSWHCDVVLSVSKATNGRKTQKTNNSSKLANGRRLNGKKSAAAVDLLNSSITYDGDVSLFVASPNDHSVHVFNTDGAYERKLLSPDEGIVTPCSLAIDKYRRQLCVGQKGEVLICQLEDKWWRPSMVFNDVGEYRNSAFSDTALV